MSGGRKVGARQKGEAQGEERREGSERESETEAWQRGPIPKGQRRRSRHVVTMRATIISKISQPNQMHATVQGKEHSVPVLTSLTLTSVPFDKPLPQACFSLLVQEFTGRLLKTR